MVKITDLNRKPSPRKYEPNGVEIAALVIVISIWAAMIIGAMAW